MGYFVYGMVRGESGPIPEGLLGIDAEPVSTVAAGSVAALVSPVEDEDILPMRAHLKAFQSVITSTAANSDVLPVSFGLVARDESQVEEVLADNGEVLERELSRIGGKVEYTLRLNFAGDNVFAWFTEQDPRVRRLRDSMFEGGREPTRDEKIALGQAFEEALEGRRQAENARLADALADLTAEISPVSYASEAGVAALALLVPRENRNLLDARIDEIAAQYSDDFMFEFTGPWPPYSFIELSLAI
ncbi:MAG: GvpL/GvpF family gas vesicle protein [Pseudomonadota bacterium]